MNEPRNEPTPQDAPAQADSVSQDLQVPQWVNDLVPVAESARPILLRELAYLAVALVLLVLVWDEDPAGLGAPQVLLLGLIGYGYALRRSGALARDRQEPREPVLRAGARTTMHVLVADLVCSALGLAVWGVGAVRGAQHPLLAGALAAAIAMTAAVAGLLASEVPTAAPHWLAPAARVAGTVSVMVLSLAVLRSGSLSLWWWVVALAVVADVMGVVAVRAGSRRDRAAGASGRPA